MSVTGETLLSRPLSQGVHDFGSTHTLAWEHDATHDPDRTQYRAKEREAGGGLESLCALSLLTYFSVFRRWSLRSFCRWLRSEQTSEELWERDLYIQQVCRVVEGAKRGRESPQELMR